VLTALPSAIIFYVPDGYRMSDQRVLIPKMANWETVVEMLHKNMGCDQFPRKPDCLDWKISDKNRARVMGL
jgi:hypothetical protein